MSAGVNITLTAGGITFVNQWYQEKKPDWKVPVATVLLAAGVGVLDSVDSKAATLFSILILMGAATTEFNGKSVADLVNDFVGTKGAVAPKSVSKIPNR